MADWIVVDRDGSPIHVGIAGIAGVHIESRPGSNEHAPASYVLVISLHSGSEVTKDYPDFDAAKAAQQKLLDAIQPVLKATI